MTCAAVLLSIVAIPILNSVGIPSTGETVFETAIASAISMLFSLMAVFLVLPLFFRFEHMKAQRLSVGLYALYMCLIMVTLNSFNPISNQLMSIAGTNPDPAVLGCPCGAVALATVVLGVVSCAISTKVYRARNL